MRSYRAMRTIERSKKSYGYKKEWQKENEEEGVLKKLGNGKRLKLQRLGKDFN